MSVPIYLSSIYLIYLPICMDYLVSLKNSCLEVLPSDNSECNYIWS